MNDNTPMGMAERVFSESKFRPQLYNHGFKEDVAATIQAAKLDGISQEKARILALLEAEATAWSNSSEAFHAAGEFEAEESIQWCATILRGMALKIKAAP